ncbi:MAG: helix-hairpin-helix domain-containing protein [Chitinophagales bacterium]|nr:helix-hairpin-helix domain-containing protein [Chitinophagales bacterium]MDW8427970.1 helix-hairpin-helix domain-containing protein [Chitinophagales bacterium]
MQELWKKYLKDYFIFSRAERNGILILLGVILFLAFLPRLVNFDKASGAKEWQELTAMLQAAQSQDQLGYIDPDSSSITRTNGNFSLDHLVLTQDTLDLFPFDPNTADAHMLKQLGLSERVVRNIISYRQAGGRFRFRQDLRKIYGLDESAYRRLAPFINLPERPALFSGTEESEHVTSPSSAKETAAPAHPVLDSRLELNSADSAALVELPGIGPVLARRIIRWRNQLGGFYCLEQLYEVRGMPAETVERIWDLVTVDAQKIKSFDLNSVEADVLASHPYFRRIAQLIVNYRANHGPFKSFAEIEQLEGIQPEELQRIRPYCLLPQSRPVR